MSIKRTVVMYILTLKHLTSTIDSYLSSTMQRQSSDSFSQHPVRPREHPPLHFTSAPPSGYLRLFKRKMTCPSQTCHCLTGGDFIAAGLQCVVMAGRGREGALVSWHIFHSSRGGHRERTVGGVERDWWACGFLLPLTMIEAVVISF